MFSKPSSSESYLTILLLFAFLAGCGSSGTDGREVNNKTVSPPSGLAAPSDLKADWSGSVITLSWRDNSNNETGFIVERKSAGTSETTYVKRGDVLAANTTSFADDLSTAAATAYTYHVYAVKGDEHSEFCEVFIQSPTTPTNVSKTDVTASTITLRWDASSGTATAFNVYMKVSSESGFLLNAQNVTSPYTVTGLEPNTSYDFQVTGLKGGVESAPSETFSATTSS